jgi:hypothetical protein
MRLLDEMVDLADMLRRIGEFEGGALAVAAGRKPPAVDDGNVVRHVGMEWIMGDLVDAGLRDDLARFVLLRHGWPSTKLIDDL